MVSRRKMLILRELFGSTMYIILLKIFIRFISKRVSNKYNNKVGTMFHTYRHDLTIDLIKDTNHKISPEKINELNALTEAIESAHKLDTTKPSYEAYHINRFLGCRNAFGATSNVNKKLDFGVISRGFNLEENVSNRRVDREVLLENFKYKFSIKDEKAIHISDDKSHNMFFSNAIIDPNLDIKPISDKHTFYIALTNHSKNSSLAEMIDHNIDNL